MSDHDNLRDRIAAALYCHRYPRSPRRVALAMARGEGMDAERGQTNCVQRIYVPMAQAIINELGLTEEWKPVSRQILNDGTAIENPTQSRIVGKWEPECHR